MKHPRFDVYEARDGFRWRLLAVNGRTIAESGEAYTRERDCKRAVEIVIEATVRINGKAIVARHGYPEV